MKKAEAEPPWSLPSPTFLTTIPNVSTSEMVPPDSHSDCTLSSFWLLPLKPTYSKLKKIGHPLVSVLVSLFIQSNFLRKSSSPLPLCQAITKVTHNLPVAKPMFSCIHFLVISLTFDTAEPFLLLEIFSLFSLRDPCLP